MTLSVRCEWQKLLWQIRHVIRDSCIHPVCADDYDVALKSCDDVTFRVHKNVLQMHSHGFATPDNTVVQPDDVVALSETSAVLDLLLQYMYPNPQPHLAAVEFVVLAGLAEAAQKYEVWSAMEITKVYMQ
jgi:hypothetical protein